MALIRLDYDAVIQQAVRLEQAASQCETQIQEMNKLKERLAQAWAGDSGEAMQQKCLEWIAEQKKVLEKMNQTAAQIRRTAETIRAQDQALAQHTAALGGGGAWGSIGSMGSR